MPLIARPFRRADQSRTAPVQHHATRRLNKKKNPTLPLPSPAPGLT